MLPYLSYCCAIWGNTYISRLNNLIVLQKRAIRLIANVPYLAHTAPLLHKYNCLKLEDLVKFHINNIMYKAYNFDLPCNLQFLFTKTQISINIILGIDKKKLFIKIQCEQILNL